MSKGGGEARAERDSGDEGEQKGEERKSSLESETRGRNRNVGGQTTRSPAVKWQLAQRNRCLAASGFRRGRADG